MKKIPKGKNFDTINLKPGELIHMYLDFYKYDFHPRFKFHYHCSL